MKALRCISNKLRLVEIDLPPLPEGEALIRVLLAGICATDLEIVKGYMGFEGTLGHEFVGIVEECPSQPELAGRRVVGEINVSCGKCRWCLNGMSGHCPDRTVFGILGRDGAFAEYLHLPAGNLHVVPEDVTDKAAVFVEPLSAAFEISEQIHLKSDIYVLVIGDGKLAQLIVRMLAKHGCRVDVTGVSSVKLGRMGDIPHRVYLDDQPESMSYKYVIEASGSPSGWAAAVRAVEPRGTSVLKSTFEGGFNFIPAPLVINEITVVGSRCGSFGSALSSLSDSSIDVSGLIDGEYPLDRWREAFTKAREPESLKVLLRMGDA